MSSEKLEAARNTDATKQEYVGHPYSVVMELVDDVREEVSGLRDILGEHLADNSHAEITEPKPYDSRRKVIVYKKI